MLIYTGILVFFALPGALLVAFIPLPNTSNDPNLPATLAVLVRAGGGLALFF
jgi:hypothetical protein